MISISELWKSSRQEDWFNALNRYWSYIKDRTLDVEREFDVLDSRKIEALDPEGWYRFLHDKYFVWKFTQPNVLAANQKTLQRAVKDHGIGSLASIKRQIFNFDKDDIREGLRIVTQIPGLSIKAGSGLLAVLFPRFFATIDQFLIRALQQIDEYRNDPLIQRMNPDNPKVTDGVALISMLRDKARALNKRFSSDGWTPRKIDMILWAYGH